MGGFYKNWVICTCKGSCERENIWGVLLAGPKIGNLWGLAQNSIIKGIRRWVDGQLRNPPR